MNIPAFFVAKTADYTDNLKRIGKIKLLFQARAQGLARTQSPTTKNYAPELPTFGVIAGVSPTEVQWKGLAPGGLFFFFFFQVYYDPKYMYVQ